MQPAEVWAPHPLASLQEPHSRGFSFQGDRWDSERDREREMEREGLTGKDDCSLNTNYNNNLWQVLESPGAYKVSCGKCGNPLGHEFLKDGPDGVGSRWTFSALSIRSNHFINLPGFEYSAILWSLCPRAKSKRSLSWRLFLHQHEAVTWN